MNYDTADGCVTELLNDGWEFALGKPESFSPVELPHDWLIYDVNHLYESGVGWYRRILKIDKNTQTQGRRVSLRFDGIYMDSTLFVNDKPAGEWKYGYTAFEHDITEYLDANGSNTILLRVDYKAPNSRWYTGAGIYRDVFLKIRKNCHFIPDGVYVTTYKEDGQWRYDVDAEVETNGMPYELRHALENSGEIESWDIRSPRLYTLRSELIVGGQVEDIEYTRIGFRDIGFKPDGGFFLNGRHVKLNGVCLHHDLGALGAAVHRDAIRRQLTLLRGMGVNAIRVSHNPPAKAFMELADEMGFLVMSELLDMWRLPKTEFDYARFFDEWIEKDAASWIRRDRNHPSLIMWSVGNEIYDTHADAEDGAKTLRRLMSLVEKHDPRRHAPPTLCSNYMPWENTQKCADIIKLVGYNYAERLYAAHHAAHPDWLIYGSETCSTVQSRGVYHFPLSRSILSDDDLQCSSLGNSSTSWGASSVEACVIADRDTPFSAGQFIWAGQDYIGEPTPYHTKSSYLGHLDTAGFPKDSYYVFRAAWTEDTPVLHLYPYWDFSHGQMIDVRVCTNAHKAELFLNGKSLGVREPGDGYIADWRVPYKKGVLRAVAYDENGAAAAETERRSFGDAVSLRLENETYGELTFVTITALDGDGNTVENANCRVNVGVEGGTLLGMDNGDSTDYDQYKTNSRRMFNGKLLAIVKSGGGVPQVTAEIDKSDVPIRKIELSADGYNITACIYPENASYRELFWRLTDAGGIDSPLGTLDVSEDGLSAVVMPRGDGEMYVRCAAKNGRGHAAVMSQLEMTVNGMGKPFTDPYSFVSAGLYNLSNAAMTNGNERGVATLRDAESHVGFSDLDFGGYGADEVTIPLFPLSAEPFSFGIWEGMPSEGGELLLEAYYDKGSIWNTYQNVTYKLPKRLRGVTTLCLTFRQKVHIKGFCFTKLDKAFQKLMAAESDGLYGDRFTVDKNAVRNIGNNVSLIYKDMDFGGAGAASVALRWRSEIEKNSIRFVFSGGGTETLRMVEVACAADGAETVFSLGERIFGKQTVTLVFLPGCDLDLEWIQFLQ